MSHIKRPKIDWEEHWHTQSCREDLLTVHHDVEAQAPEAMGMGESLEDAQTKTLKTFFLSSLSTNRPIQLTDEEVEELQKRLEALS